MSRADRVLVVVGALCAIVWLARTVPGVAGTLLGGSILAGLLALSWRWWREAQEVRLLRGFVQESGGHLDRTVALYKAVAHAKLQDPSPVMDRLLRKRQIGPWYDNRPGNLEPDEWLTDKDRIDPDYFVLNHEGRARAKERRWWYPGGLWV